LRAFGSAAVAQVAHEADIKKLYLEVNKAEAVKEIDLPDALAPALKAHIDGACEMVRRRPTAARRAVAHRRSARARAHGRVWTALRRVARLTAAARRTHAATHPQLCKAYSEMHKPSERCRPPHLHRDTLRNKLFLSHAAQQSRSAQQLYAMIMRVNETLRARPTNAWHAPRRALTQPTVTRRHHAHTNPRTSFDMHVRPRTAACCHIARHAARCTDARRCSECGVRTYGAAAWRHRPERVRQKPLEKARAHGLYLGLDDYGWIDLLGQP
jgi:hypothetical protein